MIAVTGESTGVPILRWLLTLKGISTEHNVAREASALYLSDHHGNCRVSVAGVSAPLSELLKPGVEYEIEIHPRRSHA